MAAQDILSLGINVDSFDEQKRTVLNDYISLFNQLSKYDGKVFNPVLGGGLLDLNNSIKETNILLGQLNASLESVSKPISTVGTSSAVTSAEIQKLTASVTQQEKQIAALKLQLSSFTQSLISNNPVTQQSTLNLIQNGVAAKSLTTDYLLLKGALKEQGLAYSNAYLQQGKDNPATKEALTKYAGTASVVNDINGKLNQSHSALSVIGKDLSTYYNRLRIIAYILPGIGVAGIFSDGAAALGYLLDELGVFNNSLEEGADFEKKINDLLKERLSIYDDINKKQKEVQEINPIGTKSLDDQFKIYKDAGTAPESNEAMDIKKALDAKKLAMVDVNKYFGKTVIDPLFGMDAANDNTVIQKMHEEVQKRLNEVDNAQQKLDAINKKMGVKAAIMESANETPLINSLGIKVMDKLNMLPGLESDKTSGKLKAAAESELANANIRYKDQLDTAKNYNQKVLDYEDKITVHKRANELRSLEFTKDIADQEISLEKDKQEKIISDSISTEKEKLDAINKIRSESLKENQAALNRIINDSASTQDQKDSARNRYEDTPSHRGTENVKVILSNIQARIKTEEEYNQIRIKSIAEIQKYSLDADATTNQKIIDREGNSYKEKIDAYRNYIKDKQKEDDITFSEGTSARKFQSSDPAIQLQIKEQAAHRDTDKLNIQADAEKKIYDIVYTYEHKQLELIKDVNDTRYSDTKAAHAKEIDELTDSFNRKEISYRKYYREITRLEKNAKIGDLEGDVKVDELNLSDLKKKQESVHKQGKIDQTNVEIAGAGLGFAKDNGIDTLKYKLEYDIAVGNEEAISKSIIDIDKATKEAQAKLDDDKFRLTMARIELEKKAHDELAKVITEIGNKVLDGAKEQIDAGYQYQENVVERKKNLVDEGLQSELNAISISTLSNKDKAALDIQLNEQKRENDKNADLEERRLKRSQAEADRAFAVAQIIWNTERAISKTYADFGSNPIAFPLAIAQGVLGAVEIATVLATPIPAFKEGVRGFSGGLARTGEDGIEEIREPYKSPYLVYKDTVSYLPAGTDVIPIDDMAVPEERIDTGWDQTRWLAKQMKKNNREIKNVFRPVINIDLGFENHKRKMLGI